MARGAEIRCLLKALVYSAVILGRNRLYGRARGLSPGATVLGGSWVLSSTSQRVGIDFHRKVGGDDPFKCTGPFNSDVVGT